MNMARRGRPHPTPSPMHTLTPNLTPLRLPPPHPAQVGDCFIYNNAAWRLNYCVGGEVTTLYHLDK